MGWFRFRQGKEKAALRQKTLNTERLLLRAFEANDGLDVFAYAKSPRVGPMAGWAPHKTLEESQSMVGRFMQRDDVWAVVERKSGRIIGSVGLHKDQKRDLETARMLGYAFGEAYWGQGYATEAAGEMLRYAFEETQCPIVSVYHFPVNGGSKRVIEKLGFIPEGELRMASVLPDGSLQNDVCYSLTRQEYDKLHQSKPEG